MSVFHLLENVLEDVKLPQTKNLILPPVAHPLLRRYCNVEDVACVIRHENVPPDRFLRFLASNQDSSVERLATPLGGLKDWAISCLKSETGSQEGERRKRTTLSELRVIELSPDRPLLDSVELNVEVYEIQRFDRKGLQRHVRWDIQRHYEVTRQKQNMVGNVCGWARPNSNG